MQTFGSDNTCLRGVDKHNLLIFRTAGNRTLVLCLSRMGPPTGRGVRAREMPWLLLVFGLMSGCR